MKALYLKPCENPLGAWKGSSFSLRAIIPTFYCHQTPNKAPFSTYPRRTGIHFNHQKLSQKNHKAFRYVLAEIWRTYVGVGTEGIRPRERNTAAGQFIYVDIAVHTKDAGLIR